MPSLKKSLRREPSSADEEEDDGIFGWQAPTGVLPRHDLVSPPCLLSGLPSASARSDLSGPRLQITPFLAPPSLSSGDASSVSPFRNQDASSSLLTSELTI